MGVRITENFIRETEALRKWLKVTDVCENGAVARHHKWRINLSPFTFWKNCFCLFLQLHPLWDVWVKMQSGCGCYRLVAPYEAHGWKL